jgi:Fe2+ transport system protein FeoA
MKILTLDKLAPGESGRIIKISGRGAIRRRLVDMGLTTGAVIDMIKISPLGDPVEYRLRGYHLSLRKSEAETIEVELIETPFSLKETQVNQHTQIPLISCKAGQKVIISGSRGGRRLRRKLTNLGLVPGVEIHVVNNDFPGPLIISVNDESRLILGKRMALHVLVIPS